jgi:hypothetical protein
MSQFEVNKAIIQHYFEAYNNKNEAIFEEMVSPLILEIFFCNYLGELSGLRSLAVLQKWTV